MAKRIYGLYVDANMRIFPTVALPQPLASRAFQNAMFSLLGRNPRLRPVGHEWSRSIGEQERWLRDLSTK